MDIGGATAAAPCGRLIDEYAIVTHPVWCAHAVLHGLDKLGEPEPVEARTFPDGVC